MAPDTITVEIRIVKRPLWQRVLYWPRLVVIDFLLLSEHYDAPLWLRAWAALKLSFLGLFEIKVGK